MGWSEATESRGPIGSWHDQSCWAEWSYMCGNELHHSLLSGTGITAADLLSLRQYFWNIKKSQKSKAAPKSQLFSTHLTGTMECDYSCVFQDPKERVIATWGLLSRRLARWELQSWSFSRSNPENQWCPLDQQAVQAQEADHPDTWSHQTTSLTPLDPHSTLRGRGWVC